MTIENAPKITICLCIVSPSFSRWQKMHLDLDHTIYGYRKYSESDNAFRFRSYI